MGPDASCCARHVTLDDVGNEENAAQADEAAAADMDAEALYQDAWMRVIEARWQWRHDQPFKPWLYRIARNLCIDLLRRRPRELRTPDLDPTSAAPVSAPRVSA